MKIYDPHITGSLSVSSSADIQGDLTVGGTIYGTAQINGSVETATSASHAASYVLTSSYEIFTASVGTGSFTGSFSGDGSELTDIPATAVTGLSLDSLASSTATASISSTELVTNVSIIPKLTDTIDLGSPSKQWRDLYLSSGSLYINGQQVISTTGTELRITTDNGESIKILEEGSDTITLQSENGDITLSSSGTGNIELDAPIQITAGNKILSSDGNSIVFGNGVIITGSISLTGNVDGVEIGTFKSTFDTTTGSFDGRLDNLETSTGSLSTKNTTQDGRLDSIEIKTGSLETKNTTQDGRLGSLETNSGSQATSIGNLESFQSDVETGIQFTGSNVTIKGNLLVKGTETKVDSTTVDIADNIISLNGSGAVNAGIEVRDTEAPGTTSGSLVYDTGDNQWKGGLKGSEKRLLNSDDLTTIDSSIGSLENESGSVKLRLNEIESTTGSHNTRIGGLETISGSHDGRLDSIETKTGSLTTDISTLDGRVDSLETKTGSLDTTNTSQNNRLDNIETKTGSLETTDTSQNSRLSSIELFTGSLDATFASDADVTTLRNDLNTYTSSNDTTNTNQNSRLGSLEATSGSIESFTSSIDTTIKNKLNSETVISSSIQIDHDTTTNFSANEHIDHSTITIGSGKGLIGGGTIDTNRSLTLETGSNHFLGGVKSKLNTETVVSGSVQIDITNTTNYNLVDGRLDLIELFTGSIDDTFATDSDVTTLRTDFNDYTSSNTSERSTLSGRVGSLETKTGSLETTNTSQNNRLDLIEIVTGSQKTKLLQHGNRLDSLEVTSGSHDDRLDDIESKTGSFATNNYYTTGATFNSSNGVVTGTRNDGNSWTVDLDGRYLTSFTETDPIFGASPSAGITNGKISNWDTAYGWGDHSVVGYLTSYNDEYTTGATFNGSSGIITFVRNDGDTFTLDISSTLTDINVTGGTYNDSSQTLTLNKSNGGSIDITGFAVDTVLHTTGATFNTSDGVVTFTKNGGDTYTVDLDGRFLTSFTETDPVFTAHAAFGVTTTKISNWDTAYGWGDHSLGGYLTSHPNISAESSSNNSGRTYIQDILLDGNGHVTGITTASESVVNTDEFTTGATFNTSNGVITFTRNDGDTFTVDIDGRFLTSYTETDPVFTAHVAHGITSTNISNWNTAYGWGDHSLGGYLTSLPSHNHDDRYYTETEIGNFFDGTTSITGYDRSNWNTAYGWGDHSLGGYLTSHPNISAASSSNNSGRTYIQDILLDGNGHVTGITTATETLVSSDEFTTGATFNTSDGILTFTRNDGDTFTVDIDGRFLTSFTESDPVFMASPSAGITFGKITNWDTAYGWGDHSVEGYLKSFTETYTQHEDISAASSSNNSGRTYIQDILLDDNGHVTGLTTSTESVVNTDEFVTGATFNSGNAVLTFTRNDGDTFTVTLLDTLSDVTVTSGTYDDSSQTLTLTKSDGSTVDVNGFAVDTVLHTTGATFNSSNGIITFTKNGGDTYTVDLDGRFLPLAGGTLTGDLTIPDYINHTGDSGTKFGFSADETFVVVSGGSVRLTVNDIDATFAGDITILEDLYATNQNLKFHAGGTHVMNIDVNGKVYPAIHNAYDIGHSTSLAWRNLYLSGTVTASGGNSGNWNTAYGWGDHSLAGYISSFTDTNEFTTGVTFNTSNGILTFTRNNGGDTFTVDLDGRFLTSFTETDPVFTAHAAFGVTTTKISNWDTAYGWGDHSLAGYISSFTDTNEFVTGATFNTSDGKITFTRNNGGDTFNVDLDGRFLTSFTESDPIFTAHAAFGVTTTKISNWDTAYGWGDHGLSAQDKTDIGNLSGVNTGDQTLPTDFVSAANGGTFSGNVNVFPNASTGTFRVGRFAGQEFKLHATDLTNTLTSIQDADENQGHSFILNREHAGSGDDDFKIQKDGSDQLTINKDGNTVISGTLSATGYNNSNWDTAYGWGDHSLAGYISSFTNTNEFTTGATFNTSNGVVTFTRNNGGDTFTVDLDGRYLTSFTETYTQHDNISAASSSNNSGRTYIQDILLDSNGHVTGLTTATETVTDSGNDNDIDYISGATFNSSTGVITGVGTGNAGFTVDIDGRFLTSYTETDTLDSVTDRGATTTNNITVGNIGIGASPSHPLDVKGADTDNSTIARFYSNTGARGSFIIRNGSGVNPTTFIGTAGGSEQLSIGTNNTEAIRLDASQNTRFTGGVIIEGGSDRITAEGSSMYLGGGNGNTTLIQFSGKAIPDSDKSHDLGQTNRYWKNAYIDVVTATGGNSTNWNTAYGWGDHSVAGYISSFTDTNEFVTGATFDGNTGIVTFTRNNGGDTFNVDISSTLTDINVTGGTYNDANQTLTLNKSNGGSVDVTGFAVDTVLHTTGATFNTGNGIITFTKNGGATYTVDLDGRHVKLGGDTMTGTLTVPTIQLGSTTFSKSGDQNHVHFAGTALIPTTTTTSSNSKMGTSAYRWNGVYGGVGDFSGTVTASGGNSGNWNTAYGWGDHSVAGYISSFTDTNEFTTGATFNSGNGVITFTRNNGGATFTVDIDGRYLTSFTESDPVFSASAAGGISSSDITNWDTAYGWGDHSQAGYLTSSSTQSKYLRSDANDTTTGALTIGGSIDSGGTDMGYYQSAGTNIVLKGDSVGRSGIFFESEKDGTNINDPSDYGFIQFHSYGYGNTTGESAAMVIGVSNDAADKLILQAPYNGGVMIGYKDATSGVDLTLSEVIHSNASSYNDGNWNTAYGWGDHASGGYAADNSVVKLTGNQSISGTKKFSNSSLVIEGSHGTISFMDTSSEDNFYIHVNSNNFYVLADRDGSDTIDGGYETPHPLQLEGNTNTAYVFGSALNISNWNTAYGWGDHSSGGYLTSLPSHNHDDRYYTESEMKAYFDRGYIDSFSQSNLAVGWYTIATNTGDRALGEFQIWDTASSDHQSVLFSASHHFGTDTSNDITVTANSRYSGTNFRYIRIKDHDTYAGAALQVYVDADSNSVYAAIVGGNAQMSGWVLKNWVADASDPGDVSNWSSFGERAKVDLDLTVNGGIITTGEIYAGSQTTQNKVYHSGNFTDSSTNWNTAYGWGDHSVAGYITSPDGGNATTLDTLDSTQFLRSDTADTFTGTITMGTQHALVANNYGRGVYGLYSSTKYQHVWSMGTSYNLSDDGSTSGNLYGISFTHTNVGGQSKSGLDHQMLIMRNGVTVSAIGAGIWTDGTITTTSHGNSSQWNTAYGWGDHSGAGYTSNTGTLTDTNDRNYITDSRGSARAPSYYDDRYAQWDFQNTSDTGVGGDGWHALLTVSKWASFDASHRQEQLIFSGDHLWRRTATSDSAWGTNKKIWDSGNLTNNSSNWDTAYGWGNHASGGYLSTSGKAADSNLLDGIDLHTGRNNEANKVVRTDVNGYIQAGWINTTSGDNGTNSISRIYASGDGYIRYYSPTNFINTLGIVTTTGYNKSNWDTAYGWGDHSQAGYITSSASNPYQETTVTYTASQINAGFGGNGTTIIAAPGSGKTLVVYETSYLIKSNYRSSTSTGIELRQPGSPGSVTISKLPSYTWQQASLVGGNVIYERDVPINGRTYGENLATTIHRTGGTVSGGFNSISIKIRYRIFDVNNF